MAVIPVQTNPEQESNSQTQSSTLLDNSIEAFEREIKQPTTPAMGTTQPAGPAPVYQPAPAAEPAPVVHDPTKPLFSEDDTQAGTGYTNDFEPGEKPKPKYSEDYKNKTIGYYIDIEEAGTAELCCLITKTKDTALFKYTDKQKEWLLNALEPYKDFIIEALPAWLPLMLIYGGMKFDQVVHAVQIVNANKANEQGKSNPAKMQKVGAAANSKIERTNFMLYRDGYYAKDRSGNYIKRDGDPENAAKLEKPSMDDLEKILAAKANNHADLLEAAFGIKPADYARYGIVLKQD